MHFDEHDLVELGRYSTMTRLSARAVHMTGICATRAFATIRCAKPERHTIPQRRLQLIDKQ